jgi:DNA topoisomerase-2
MTDLSKQYRKHTHREHILSLPDTYIGSIENCSEEHFVVHDESFIQTTISCFNPGFYKLFDELLVNAHDQVIRLRQKNSQNPVKDINVSVTEDGVIEISNSGEAIDVEIHPEYKIYIPQLIFAELLTSTNYDKTEKKLVGGKNGYGVKLVNIFSKKLQITIVDSTRQLKYTQIFENNMTKINEPQIKPSKSKSMVSVQWTPDYEKFGFNEIPSDLLAVIKRRVFDLAMTVGKEVRVTWCDTPIKFRDFTSYASWYLPKDTTIITDIPQMGWHIALSDNPFDKLFNVSFVNGIWTRSGKHVDEITNQVVSHIVNFLETKKKIKVKPALIKDSLCVFINCFVENPSFNSQTKEVLTSKVSCKLSDDFLKKVVTKLSIVEKVMELQEQKDAKDMKKTDGKKSVKITGIPKLDDAVFAGTARSHECILILTEGDSAKAMAISGLSQEQRKFHGVFPLKGKLLNVKDISQKKVEQTEEIANLKKIIGLESGKKYSDVKSLRYGKIMIMTDQDYDGSHIRGLLINMFHELWHELIQIPGFITYMITPIVKAHKGSKEKVFYTQYDYEEWRKSEESKGWKTKYYKGLGTSTRDEAREYFKSLNIINYDYQGSSSDQSIELAFNKSMADQRKEWLKSYSRSEIILAGPGEKVSYEDFVNKDLIHFSNYNLERSIPSIMDGLKTSQRKILFSCFKRNLRNEIRVAQLAGYVSEHSGYHHGEASLNDAIIGMAQDFVGSNNIPWLVPQGQFGTRLEGGKDSASPRYIHTYLQPQIHNLVPHDDFDVLEYRDDDGLLVEPNWYAPILPMILVNGSRGIGTGYSTFIPSFNPSQLKSMIIKWLETGKGLEQELVPWTRGFRGKISKLDKLDYLVEGSWKITKDQVEITELPIGTWISDFREILEKFLADGTIKDYSDTSTDTDILIKLKLGDGGVPAIEKVLQDKIRLSNMHLFNSENCIRKYSSPNEILSEYVYVRLDLYSKRREYILKSLKEKLPYHENIVRFITQQSLKEPLPDLRRKTVEECSELLTKEKFLKISDSFDYLLDLPIRSLTLKNTQKHEKDLVDLREKIKILESTTPSKMWLDDLNSLKI